MTLHEAQRCQLAHILFACCPLRVVAVRLLRADLARFSSRRSVGAVCPFIGIHPQVDRETLFFFKYLGVLPGGNAI